MDVEFAVVGGGIMGLCTAWRLGLHGREVLLVERFVLGHDRGSSHGPTRIFRFAYDDPHYVRMAQRSLPLWRELEQGGDALVHITGGVDAGDGPYLTRLAGALWSCGAAAERLDPGETAARFPWLQTAGEPAVFSPDTGVIAAAAACRSAAEAARAHRVAIWEDTAVRAIAIDDGSVTLGTARGEVRARRCIVTAGGWTAGLLAPLGIRLPLRVTREQVFYFRGDGVPIPFIHRAELFRYGMPAMGGAPGVKVAEHGTGAETTAEDRTFEPDRAARERLRAYVRSALPGLDPEPVAEQTCLYTNSPDDDFVIDVRGPLVIASPCSGHGFKFAPLVGETLARLATGGEPGLDISRFRIGRFAG